MLEDRNRMNNMVEVMKELRVELETFIADTGDDEITKVHKETDYRIDAEIYTEDTRWSIESGPRLVSVQYDIDEDELEITMFNTMFSEDEIINMIRDTIRNLGTYQTE